MHLRKRFLIGVAAASLGLARIAAPSCDKTDCDKKPRSHTLLVTSKGVSCKDAYVRVKLQNTIKWCAASGNLVVWFDKPADPTAPNPYPKLVCGSTNMCKSGPIDPHAKPGTYSYHIVLDGTAVDPNVIIGN